MVYCNKETDFGLIKKFLKSAMVTKNALTLKDSFEPRKTEVTLRAAHFMILWLKV